MGRYEKKGLDWFPFDVGFFDDERIMAISGEFGIKGEITTVKLLCAIYQNGYYALWNDMLKFGLAKSSPGISPELTSSIVYRLVKWGYFDKTLFDSESVLTNEEIQERYFSATQRRKRQSKDYPYLLVDAFKNQQRSGFMSTEKDNDADLCQHKSSPDPINVDRKNSVKKHLCQHKCINVDINAVPSGFMSTEIGRVRENNILSPDGANNYLSVVDVDEEKAREERKDGQGRQVVTVPAAQEEKKVAPKKEEAGGERVPARTDARLGTEEIIAEIEGREITAEQLAMLNGLSPEQWRQVKAEIFAQWRFEGYSRNSLQDALNHFANLVRKKAEAIRGKPVPKDRERDFDAMLAGMLATARSPEQQQADDERFKQDFGL